MGKYEAFNKGALVRLLSQVVYSLLRKRDVNVLSPGILTWPAWATLRYLFHFLSFSGCLSSLKVKAHEERGDLPHVGAIGMHLVNKGEQVTNAHRLESDMGRAVDAARLDNPRDTVGGSPENGGDAVFLVVASVSLNVAQYVLKAIRGRGRTRIIAADLALADEGSYAGGELGFGKGHRRTSSVVGLVKHLLTIYIIIHMYINVKGFCHEFCEFSENWKNSLEGL